VIYVESVAAEMRFIPCVVGARMFFYSLIAHVGFSLLFQKLCWEL
jgi:hypothetical protein